MSKIRLLLLLLALCAVENLSSQDLLDILDDETKNSNYVPATFKMTRIALGHSTEVRPKNVLEVFVANRFWNLPTAESKSFIANRMSSRFALEYGISDRLSFGTGATTFDGLFDGYIKYKLAKQQIDGQGSPVTVTLFQNTSYNSSPLANQSIQDNSSDRLAYTTQLLISRRFTKNFSFQLSPTMVNRTLGLTEDDPTTIFALGAGMRFKLGPHLSLVSEYYARFNPLESVDTSSPVAFGLNWELGDVMLQFMLTNTWFMVEDSFITRAPLEFNFQNPNLNFGFNATYVIHFKNRLKD